MAIASSSSKRMGKCPSRSFCDGTSRRRSARCSSACVRSPRGTESRKRSTTRLDQTAYRACSCRGTSRLRLATPRPESAWLLVPRRRPPRGSCCNARHRRAPHGRNQRSTWLGSDTCRNPSASRSALGRTRCRRSRVGKGRGTSRDDDRKLWRARPEQSSARGRRRELLISRRIQVVESPRCTISCLV